MSDWVDVTRPSDPPNVRRWTTPQNAAKIAAMPPELCAEIERIEDEISASVLDALTRTS